MKLIKKILPLTMFAATMTVAAPIITSCGMTMDDLSKYEAQITPATTIGGKTLTDFYFESENFDKIFADDWKVSIRKTAEEENSKSKVDYVKGYVKNIKKETKTYESVKYFLLSFDLGYEYSTTITEEEEGIQSITNFYQKNVSRVTNVPFVIKSGSNWKVTPNTSLDPSKWSSLASNWNITNKVATNVTSTIKAKDGIVMGKIVEKGEMDYLFNKDNLPVSAAYWDDMITLEQPHYLTNVHG